MKYTLGGWLSVSIAEAVRLRCRCVEDALRLLIVVDDEQGRWRLGRRASTTNAVGFEEVERTFEGLNHANIYSLLVVRMYVTTQKKVMHTMISLLL